MSLHSYWHIAESERPVLFGVIVAFGSETDDVAEQFESLTHELAVRRRVTRSSIIRQWFLVLCAIVHPCPPVTLPHTTTIHSATQARAGFEGT